jgi:hypothetical protein
VHSGSDDDTAEPVTYDSLTSKLKEASDSGALADTFVAAAKTQGANVTVTFNVPVTEDLYAERPVSEASTGAEIVSVVIGAILLLALIAIVAIFFLGYPFGAGAGVGEGAEESSSTEFYTPSGVDTQL